jgi:alpha-1,2-mannosyltransferase
VTDVRQRSIGQSRSAELREPSRAFLVLIAAVAGCAAIYGWLVFATTFTNPGAIGFNFNTIGTDWMVFHGAARRFLDGQLASVFDGDRFTAYLNQSYAHWLTSKLAFRPWVYPPSYLLLLLPFGRLGFMTSYVLFQLATAAALAASIAVGDDRDRQTRWMIAAGALLCPASSINAASGQNAFLIAALLIGGVRLMKDRPLLAGVVFGLLSIKPQLAIMAPIALIAAGRWRTLSSAAATALALMVASALVIGVDPWIIWLQQTLGALVAPSAKWIEYGRMWGCSVWTCAVLLGAPPALASILQLAASLFSVVAVAVAFRRPLSQPIRIAVLLAATCLAAPHWSPYDAIMLTIAGFCWLSEQRQRGAWPAIVVLALWLAPLASPPLIMPVSRLLPVLIVGFIAVAIWGTRQDVEAAAAKPIAQPA